MIYLLTIDCLPNNNYIGIYEMPVISGRKYKASSEVMGITGKLYGAFFGIALLDKTKQPMARRIRWLSDFSGEMKRYDIIFQVPEGCNSIRIVYKINKETPIKSICKYVITEPNKVSLSEVNQDVPESYESESDCVLPRIEELSKEQELTLEKNIIWIFGSRRSGTTWLAQQLLSFNTEYMHEPDITEHLAVGSEYVTSHKMRKIDFREDVSVYFFSKQYKKTWMPYLKQLILYRIYAQVQEYNRKIIIKEPSTELDASDIISECMPESKIIVLLRDGRDIIDSFIDGRQKGGWLATTESTIIKTESERLQFIEYQGIIWVKQMEIILKAYENHKEDLRFLLKYEDLRLNTFEFTRKLYDFLKIDISTKDIQNIVAKYSFENIQPERRGDGKFYRSATPGKWKESFNDKEKDLMHQIMGSMLQRLGYEV